VSWHSTGPKDRLADPSPDGKLGKFERWTPGGNAMLHVHPPEVLLYLATST
jgi:hypothetical protein